MPTKLILRQEQMKVFEQDALRRHEQRLMRHVRKSFPKHTESLGPEKLQPFIRNAVERARRYGIEGERGGRLFVECLFLFGHQFDSDPQLAWAAGALRDGQLTEEGKVDQLHEQSRDYLEQTAGASGQNFERALSRLRDEADEFLPPALEWASENGRLVGLHHLFPEKAQYLGADNLRRLVRSGAEQAGPYGITAERGIAIYLSLMFLLGIGFDTDPQFEWIAAILNSGEPETERVEQLYREAKIRVEQWIGPGQPEEE